MADVKYDVPKNGGGEIEAAARAAADAGARQAKEGARTAETVAEKATEAGRAATRANAEILHIQFETAQQAVHSGLEVGMRGFESLTENLTQAFGVVKPNPELAEKSARNIEAVSRASSALAKGAQEASRAWFDLAQKSARVNLEAVGQLTSCRSLQEIMNLQSNLLRNQLQHAISSGDAITRANSNAIQEATRAMQPRPQAVT